MSASLPPLLRRIRELIAVPSVSSVSPDLDQGNQAVIDLLAGWLEDAGFQCQIQSLPGPPAKANLIATLGRRDPQGPGALVLAGHTDTVPFDGDLWQHDPFAGEQADGRIYGLGSADMKSFLALALEAAEGLDPKRMQAPLVILATADEESSMRGARALVQAQREGAPPLGRFAVIGEPTGMRPVRMHKGILMDAVRVTGRSGHSSDPSLGNSALEGMHQVIGEILAWRAELQAQHRNRLFAVPYPTLNLGRIQGGDNPNRICGHCELTFDLRPLPGMNADELRAALHERLNQRLAGSGLGWELEALFAGVPAMETPADSPIVQAVEALTGQAAEAVAFGTEAPYFRELGMDTVVLGPGDIRQAHQPDEFLALDTLKPTVDLLQQLIRRFCLEPAA